MTEWGNKNKLLNVAMFSTTSWEIVLIADVMGDVGRMLVAFFLISTYSMFVLGSCSPIHFRSVLSTIGLTCVILATTAGYGFSFAVG